MKAKRRFNIWLWVLLCVPCLLASCDHDVHGGEDDGGLSVSLTWADEADQGTEVKDVKLWIFNADDGSLVEENIIVVLRRWQASVLLCLKDRIASWLPPISQNRLLSVNRPGL